MIKCTKFKSYIRGSLQGFFDVFIPSFGLHIKGCALHMKDGKRWINLPSKEYTNEEGETKYSSILLFEKTERYEEFSKECKRAIDEFCIENNISR